MKHLIILLSACLFTSCTSIILKTIGFNKYKEVDEKLIKKFASKYDIPHEDCYVLDTTYFSYLFSFDTVQYAKQIKNHYQPLQASYYNKGELKSFQINCYAGGFPNLNWDRDSIMDSFPPKEQAPLDSLLPLAKHIELINPMNDSKVLNIEKSDYIVIVHWSRFMGRHSKHLIEFIQENSTLAPDKNIRIIYVNNDEVFKAEFDF